MDNLGEKIRKQRELKKMTIEQLSEETFLSVSILKDIEAGKFDKYQGDETYVKMYLKKISDVLDLDKDDITQSYIVLTQEIKLSQLKEKEDEEKNQENIVKKGKDFKFGAPHLTRNQSVYEDKSHIKIIRAAIIIILVALVVGVLWWGISKTKSTIDDPTFNPQQNTTVEGDLDDNDDSKDKPIDNGDQNKDDDKSNVTFTRNDKLNFDMVLDSSVTQFTFKIEFGNDSWASLKVNGQDSSEFEAKTYTSGDVVELTFNTDEFESLDLKNGYSMGHKYYINDVEIPLTEDDSSESITHLILTLKKN